MKISLKALLLGCAASLFFFSCEKKNTNNEETLNAQDHNFILQAETTNTAEIQAGQLAGSTADSSAIQTFASKLVSDHQAAQNDLKSLGTTDNVNVVDSIDASQTMTIDSLKGLTGHAFDSVFIMNQIQVNNQAIADYQAEINAGNKSNLISYANKYLPTLQMHLTTADSLATAMHFK